MIDAKKVYPNAYKGLWDIIYNYDPMIEAFGNVALKADIGSYQGDTLVLYDEGGKIGYLVFGWGSCTVCDALKACDSYEDLQELCDRLENDIRWFASKSEALHYFETYDWDGQWLYHEIGAYEFIAKCIAYLKGESEC